MDLDVTSRATPVLRIQIVRGTSRLIRADTMVHAVTSQTKMIDCTELQHPGISRTMRHVTGNAPVRLHRSMFEREWTLFVRMTLDACRVCADSQARLLQLETTVWIVAIGAAHGAF